MTPDQMAELAARLHVAADSQREYSQSVESLDWAADLDRAADLIAGMAQRVPLCDEQIAKIVREAGRGSALRRDGSTSYRIARAIEQAHGIRHEDAA